MRKVATSVLASMLIITVGLALWGCHADPDDAAGQAGELTDPVRRENALRNIQRLYSAALAATAPTSFPVTIAATKPSTAFIAPSALPR